MDKLVEAREKAFWNGRTAERLGDINYYGGMVNTPDAKLIALHRFALDRLGDLSGKRVLDAGCGYGGISCALAKRGARVTAVDISEESVEASRRWFRENGVEDRVEARVASLNDVSFLPEGSFDFIVGSCVLHHLDLPAAMPGFRRLLKPGGRGVFVENNGTQPLLMFFRNRVLAPLGMRRGSPDESPMDDSKLAAVRAAFPKTTAHFPEMVFLRLAASFFFRDFGPVRRALEWADTQLWRFVPAARGWSYFNVLEIEREP